jgi:phytoene dehydrogenase-like protein
MPDCDYLIVGAGINGLVAASIPGKKGRKVIVLELTTESGAACTARKSRRWASFMT